MYKRQTAESAADDYSYLADFSFSDAYDENGYLKGVTALDYVTLPDTESFTLSDDATTVSDSDIDAVSYTHLGYPPG